MLGYESPVILNFENMNKCNDFYLPLWGYNYVKDIVSSVYNVAVQFETKPDRTHGYLLKNTYKSKHLEYIIYE